jgi:hypothetical protein
MSHDLLCAWLKIPADRWPPDHYTLLGLDPGEADPVRIEQHVHQRHECLLRYQLMHPELVTEGMNRLAQAFNCLSDPAAKKGYDAALFPDRVAAAPPPSVPLELVPTPTPAAPPPADTPDPLAWLFGPWSQSAVDTTPPGQATVETPAAPPESAAPSAAPPEIPAPHELPTPLAELGPQDPVVEMAALSAPARRGLGTKRALYYRISRTRQLLRTWMQLGKYLGEANFPLTKKPDAIDLVRQLGQLRQLLEGFPPLLGQAGQSGYLVIVLARQQMIVQTFVALLPSQRDALAKDWLKGLELLAAHRRFLRDELWALRRKSWLGRCFRAARALVTDYPGLWLLLLALLAVNLAYPVPVPLRWTQAVVVSLGLSSFIVYRTFFTRRAWLARSRRTPRERSPIVKAQKQTS